ncbi:MAG TPA: mechanosensitive ion channel family protein [Methanoregulaceae archaeon]|nr:mechanosensitive ion channel family protein [Methanoregulaceae archaeon]
MLTVVITETGMALTDVGIATAIVLAGAALAVGAYLLSLRLEERLNVLHGPGAHLVENAIIAARWPLPMAIAAAAGYVALRFVLRLDLGYPAFGDPRLPVAIAIVLITWTVTNLLSRLIRAYGERVLPESERGDETPLAELFGIGVQYLVWFIAILYLLDFLDISITPLIAGAGLAGIAIALAAQDLLSNLFGGVIILLDKPLRVGDKVRIDPYIGTVTRIGLRSTRIRTLDGLVATVPNSRITTNIVVNYTAGTARAFVQVPVTVDYATPIAESRRVLEEIAGAAPTVAPPAMELGGGAVQIGELGRFGPVFILTFSARDDTDPLAVKDAVYALVAEAVRSGRLTIGFGQQPGAGRSPLEIGSPSGDGEVPDMASRR